MVLDVSVSCFLNGILACAAYTCRYLRPRQTVHKPVCKYLTGQAVVAFRYVIVKPYKLKPALLQPVVEGRFVIIKLCNQFAYFVSCSRCVRHTGYFNRCVGGFSFYLGNFKF